MSKPRQNKHFHFGPFRLDPDEHLLLRDDHPVPLPPKAFETLLVLVEKSGHLVEKDELIKAVWPDTFVEEGNLTVHVAMLRKVLGAGENGQGFIETIPRRGYRFTAAVSQGQTGGDELVIRRQTQSRILATTTEENALPGDLVPTTSSAEYLVSRVKQHKPVVALILAVLALSLVALVFYRQWRTTEVAIDSIAVLPFTNQSNNAETEYLSDGLTEGIINILSQLPDLKVMSRNSVFRYKGQEIDAKAVGRQLNVQAVLTGRVMQRGDSLAISIELVDARDDTQLWGQKYNRPLADVFAVQEEMAREISDKLRLKLSGSQQHQLAKHPTDNLKAFQFYIQGRAYAHRRTREDLLTAIRYCEQAIKEDGNYALAYAGLADAYGSLGVRGYISASEAKLKSEKAASKALELDENLAEAHASLAPTYMAFAPYNFSLADRELSRAIELSPSLASARLYLGFSFVQQGRLDEGLEQYRKAHELDPLSPIMARGVATCYYFKRDYARALELLRRADELGPAFTSPVEVGVYIQNRLFNETLAELEKLKRERESDPLLIYSTGVIYAAQGKRTEALGIVKLLEEMSGQSLNQAQWIAKIYASLNENEQALMWLERGLGAGAIGALYKDDPLWDPIRGDPRFADLLRRMGLRP